MEERLIKNALKKYKGNITLAAEALGLTRASLYRRMEKLDLEVEVGFGSSDE
jgi:transcriptional regulator with PAS, ATPase and Fis domain